MQERHFQFWLVVLGAGAATAVGALALLEDQSAWFFGVLLGVGLGLVILGGSLIVYEFVAPSVAPFKTRNISEPLFPFMVTIQPDPDHRWAWLKVESTGPPTILRVTVMVKDTAEVEFSYRAAWRDVETPDREITRLDPGVINLGEARISRLTDHTLVRFYSRANSSGYFDKALPCPGFYRIVVNAFHTDGRTAHSEVYILHLLDEWHLELMTLGDFQVQHPRDYEKLFKA